MKITILIIAAITLASCTPAQRAVVETSWEAYTIIVPAITESK